MTSFTFGVLAYNHEAYIIEHLESIKYLVEHYGRHIAVDIVVNDDCSSDKTTMLVTQWLQANGAMFKRVTKLFNSKNIGTAKSFLNIIKNVRTTALKITAADDVYSCEDLFAYGDLPANVSILSGLPLTIIDGKLEKNNRIIIEILLSQALYQNTSMEKRFTGLSNNNAPNIFYKQAILATLQYQEFVSQYDVLEDWPTQIFISKHYPATEFSLVKKVFVYYRRTKGSTFLIANERFINDKYRLYTYLIDQSSDFFEKILLKNRRFLFKIGNPVLNKLLNLSVYIFLLKSVFVYLSVKKQADNIETLKFTKHYIHIKNRAACFLLKMQL